MNMERNTKGNEMTNHRIAAENEHGEDTAVYEAEIRRVVKEMHCSRADAIERLNARGYSPPSIHSAYDAYRG